MLSTQSLRMPIHKVKKLRWEITCEDLTIFDSVTGKLGRTTKNADRSVLNGVIWVTSMIWKQEKNEEIDFSDETPFHA